MKLEPLKHALETFFLMSELQDGLLVHLYGRELAHMAEVAWDQTLKSKCYCHKLKFKDRRAAASRRLAVQRVQRGFKGDVCVQLTVLLY